MHAMRARHTCTTHRNRAPCEKDPNCAWVNPHSRGARFKHKLLNVFTRDVQDLEGRCESSRASHVLSQRHVSPSESSSEMDLSSDPESVFPGPSFSPATTSDDEGRSFSLAHPRDQALSSSDHTRPRSPEHFSAPQTEGERSDDQHPRELLSSPRAVAIHDHAGGLRHHVVPDASDSSAPEMPARHGLDVVMSRAIDSHAKTDHAPIVKSRGSLPSPRPGEESEESEESDSEAPEHVAREQNEFYNLSMAERRRRADEAMKQSMRLSQERSGRPSARQFKFKVPGTLHEEARVRSDSKLSTETRASSAETPLSTVADMKKMWQNKFIAAPPLRPGGLALK